MQNAISYASDIFHEAVDFDTNLSTIYNVYKHSIVKLTNLIRIKKVNFKKSLKISKNIKTVRAIKDSYVSILNSLKDISNKPKTKIEKALLK